MKLNSLIAASAIALASVGASAATDIAFAGDTAIFAKTYTSASTTFSEDFTFSGLASGTYSVLGDLSGTNLNFDVSKVTFTSGAGTTAWTVTNPTAKFGFGYLEVSGPTPFSVHIEGTKATSISSNFQGSITVTAVPEPETYEIGRASCRERV